MIYTVHLSSRVVKDLVKLPRYLTEKLAMWVENVNTTGLESTRTRPGYHDEPLKGVRTGQRSIRLSRSYRAIYIIKTSDKIHIAEVIEVHKHDY